ncbi:APC family permease [Maritalea mediterranea]|uniref:APC family permease n=1 Tax=Maritalea mediterranea TaxID=2909667 RepID=A0ABS9E2Z9_9HYPH|nr:APC family permease [Maritalea mediterranea]MCF4097226.1 APC family permease [Maritalea mediterranea]
MRTPDHAQVKLNRTISLPMLIFYGVGVTIGAGIFALIGELVGLAGHQAPLAFLLAGIIAGVTGVSYAKLSSIYPRAGGEAVYVNIGMGPFWGRVVGLGVTATAIISSAVVALAFAGYFQQLLHLPTPLITSIVILTLAGIAWFGVRESVLFAAAITLLEIGALIVIGSLGAANLMDMNAVVQSLNPLAENADLIAITSAAMIAFFAFIGFEDIVNMAEETKDPEKNVPRAILVTLVLTIIVYMLVALVAVTSIEQHTLAASRAPLADLYTAVSGRDGALIALIAAIAMVNGILVQVVMASRMLYGMAQEKLVPGFFGVLDPKRQTPLYATWFVAGLTILLALSFPLVHLAQATSAIILFVFSLVNFSLWRLGGRTETPTLLRKWRWWGLSGTVICAGLLLGEAIKLI